ncbi:MAG: hypothetical protein ACYTBR_13360, partial [Planctomycetota bacterium]
CDQVVLSAPGSTQDFNRCFNLPSPAVAGLYEVCYEIREPGGLVDFLILLSQWGPCGDCADCPADFDGNCAVDVVDFLIQLANWT